jgi:hypothetical protein
VRKLSVVAVLILLSFSNKTACAQQFDAAFGVGTTLAPSGSVNTPFGTIPDVSERGGAYPAFGADILLKHHFGVSGELAWRASQNAYGGFQPYRPLLYDFGGIYAPKLGKHFSAELQGGIGFESLRFYTGFTTCGLISCTDYTSSNHFLGHFGVGLRYYVWGHFFVRPEAHFYAVHNNVEFPSSQLTRVGMSIGYTFAPGF